MLITSALFAISAILFFVLRKPKYVDINLVTKHLALRVSAEYFSKKGAMTPERFQSLHDYIFVMNKQGMRAIIADYATGMYENYGKSVPINDFEKEINCFISIVWTTIVIGFATGKDIELALDDYNRSFDKVSQMSEAELQNIEQQLSA